MSTLRRRPRGRTVATTVVATAALLGGCAQVSAQLEDAENSTLAEEVVPSTLLDTVAWSELNGLVSVIVRNPTDQVLRRADAVITVLDDAGQTLATSDTSGIEVDCCTAVNVAPGAQVGFYVQVTEAAEEAADVEVAYTNISYSATTTFGGPVAEATSSEIKANSLGTLVRTSVATTGGIIERARVQATVLDGSGDLLAVVSTTWDCLRPDQETPVRLQLFHRVPRAAEVGTVTVFPDDRARTDRAAPTCR